jgi:hypothetical protein
LDDESSHDERVEEDADGHREGELAELVQRDEGQRGELNASARPAIAIVRDARGAAIATPSRTLVF